MCDYNNEGWEPFLRQANTLLEENKLIKQNNKELESEILVLKDRIKRCEGLLYKNGILFREEFLTYQNRMLQLVQNRACFPPEWENLCTSEGLKRKFDENGQYRPFYGDTTVFPIPEEWRFSFGIFQEELYGCAGAVLSEKLPPDTFHITLHDLSAGENQALVADDVKRHEVEILPLMKYIQTDEKIHLRTAGIVSMVASSLVMLFQPVREADHIKIQKMYTLFDELSPLTYPLTLHCTLAYYKPGKYRPEQWNALMRKVAELNGHKSIEIELDCASLQYQQFDSMKDYVCIG